MPRRDFASWPDSSNQLDVLVASFVSEIWAERSAANLVAVRSSVWVFDAVLEDAETIAVVLRRLTLRPSSSVDV